MIIKILFEVLYKTYLIVLQSLKLKASCVIVSGRRLKFSVKISTVHSLSILIWKRFSFLPKIIENKASIDYMSKILQFNIHLSSKTTKSGFQSSKGIFNNHLGRRETESKKLLWLNLTPVGEFFHNKRKQDIYKKYLQVNKQRNRLIFTNNLFTCGYFNTT